MIDPHSRQRLSERHLSRMMPVRSITHGPKHHFFGYYDKCPWDVTGRFMLCLETDFADQTLDGSQTARVMLIDLQQAGQPALHLLDETRAWCWQQGNMLQWLMNGTGSEVIYNKLVDGRFVSVIADIHTGHARTLPLPIYTLSPDGVTAASLNFARLGDRRPGYGYPALPDPFKDDLRPANDGVHVMDLRTGKHNLIVSLAQIVSQFPDKADLQTHHWFNHLQFNTDGSRLAFMHRWSIGRNRRHTRLFTVKPDGTDLQLLCDWPVFSHYDWLSRTQLVAWAGHPTLGMRYFLYTLGSQTLRIVGDGLYERDGHCRFSPDRRWMLTDTYRDATGHQTLILHHLASETRIDIARLMTTDSPVRELRCDLHGRWHASTGQVCIDTMRDGSRQLAIVDVSSLTADPLWTQDANAAWPSSLPACAMQG